MEVSFTIASTRVGSLERKPSLTFHIAVVMEEFSFLQIYRLHPTNPTSSTNLSSSSYESYISFEFIVLAVLMPASRLPVLGFFPLKILSGSWFFFENYLHVNFFCNSRSRAI
ncbi:hypothetical protein CEXT_488501 [Caerostris extrusa]|uniref:Uncharacterized protein n=1 Tax=Caerostris extrusa TaxID=172846 RepID=A0AAV4RK50_CAEEX|nr:hypothetical protein CEXT_488501 [Caerostris extrusa]